MRIFLNEGPKGWIAGRLDCTRADRFPLVRVQVLRDASWVDIVRDINAKLNRSDEYMADLLEDLRENGLKMQLSVFVEIDGKITLSDGTHRVWCAHMLGWEWIKAEVRYFGNSQREFMMEYKIENL